VFFLMLTIAAVLIPARRAHVWIPSALSALSSKLA
jgi:hypothetical protein